MNAKKSPVKVIETNQRPPEGQGYMMIMNGIGTKEARSAALVQLAEVTE